MPSMSPSQYDMCSMQECKDRESNKEVSVFECVDRAAPIHRRIIDPCKAVAKYRRSAAGSVRSYPCRSMKQLETTVDHLFGLLVANAETIDSAMRSGLLDTVQFVEDRLRAVQVDLVMAQTHSKRLQRRLVRCQLVILYLMVDCPDYVPALGQKALDTAFSSYWSAGNDDTNTEEQYLDDEMLALSTLVQLNSLLQRQHAAGAASSVQSPALQDVYTNYRRHVSSTNQQSSFTLFQWALQLVADVQMGWWHVVLRRLRTCEAEFGTLARCCLAKSLSYFQFMALNVYNVSFAKAEAVPAQDLVRLLQFTLDGTGIATREGPTEPLLPAGNHVSALERNDSLTKTETACLAFGTGFGLPLHENSTSLVFKFAPVSDLQKAKVTRQDAFVFGRAPYDNPADVAVLELAKDIQALLFPTQTETLG